MKRRTSIVPILVCALLWGCASTDEPTLAQRELAACASLASLPSDHNLDLRSSQPNARYLASSQTGLVLYREASTWLPLELGTKIHAFDTFGSTAVLATETGVIVVREGRIVDQIEGIVAHTVARVATHDVSMATLTDGLRSAEWVTEERTVEFGEDASFWVAGENGTVAVVTKSVAFLGQLGDQTWRSTASGDASILLGGENGSLATVDLQTLVFTNESIGPGTIRDVWMNEDGMWALTSSTIWHNADNNAWTEAISDASYRNLEADESGALWAVGWSHLGRYVGGVWEWHFPAVGVRDIWVAATNDVWVVGDAPLAHFDGDAWQPDAQVAGELSVFAVEPGEPVFAAGHLGRIYEYTAGEWTQVPWCAP